MNKKAMVIAPLLSLLLPGLGHVYNTQMRKGVTLFLGPQLFGFSSWAGGLLNHFEGLVLILAVEIGVYAFAVVDAFRIARTRAAESIHQSAALWRLLCFYASMLLCFRYIIGEFTWGSHHFRKIFLNSGIPASDQLDGSNNYPWRLSNCRHELLQGKDSSTWGSHNLQRPRRRAVAQKGDRCRG